MRKNIYDILKQNGFSANREYDRLHKLYYEQGTLASLRKMCSVDNYVEEHFREFDRRFVGRCVSFDDFKRAYRFHFPARAGNFTEIPLDFLILFMEYLYNLLKQIRMLTYRTEEKFFFSGDRHIRFMEESIEGIVDEIGCKLVQKDGIFIIVNTTPEVIAVAEIVDEDLVMKVFEYNHHRLDGDLNAKLSILKSLADHLEPKRKELDGVSKTFSSTLFQMFNKFVRHNNDDHPVISAMNDEEKEKWYDEIYNMWLYAKLMLDRSQRDKAVKELLGKINA